MERKKNKKNKATPSTTRSTKPTKSTKSTKTWTQAIFGESGGSMLEQIARQNEALKQKYGK